MIHFSIFQYYVIDIGLSKYIAKLPSSVFEASIKGIREYTILDRVMCYLVRGIEYGACGICCGLAGQGLANTFIIIRLFF